MSRSLEPVDYLLGELEDAQLAEAEQLMVDDAEFSATVERLRPLVTALSETPREAFSPSAPPPLDIEMRRNTTEPEADAGFEWTEPRAATPARPETRRGWFSARPRVAFGAAAAGLAAAALLIALAVNGGEQTGGPEGGPVRADRITLEPIFAQSPNARGMATFEGTADDRVRVEVSGLPASAEGQVYELWILNPDRLVSLATFTIPEGGKRTISVRVPVDRRQFRWLDVSREEKGGDPAHSGNSLLQGSI
ncbi:MAG: anti-sigma factor domain-containing protein [Solirubrobacterales bacterium]